MTIKNIQAQAPDTTLRAQAAVDAFRKMQYGLTAYAQAVTGNRKVRVEISSQPPFTDGQTIYYRPPIALGDQTPHDRNICDKRDGTGLKSCPACRVREEVLVNIYHEIGHIAFGSFSGKNYVREAHTAGPYMSMIYNAIEDTRVDRAMFEARRGTKKMFLADIINLLANGVPQRDETFAYVKDAPTNAQLSLAAYMEVLDVDGWREYFDPTAVEVISDKEILAAIEVARDARGPEDTFEASKMLLKRFRELGYFMTEQEQEEQNEQRNKDAESDPDDGQGRGDDSGADDPSDEGQGSDEDGRTQGEGGDPSDSRSTDGGEDQDHSARKDDEGENRGDDESGQPDPGGHEGAASDDADSGGDEGRAEVDPDGTSDVPDAGEAGDSGAEDLSDDTDSDPVPEGPDGGLDGSSGPDGDPSDESGQPDGGSDGSTDAPSASDGAGSNATDSDQMGEGVGESADPSPDAQRDDSAGSGNQLDHSEGQRDRGDISQSGTPDGADRESLESDGTDDRGEQRGEEQSGSEVHSPDLSGEAEAIRLESIQNQGNEEAVKIILDFIHPDHTDASPIEDKVNEVSAIAVAIVQGAYFETPSTGVTDVVESGYSPTSFGWAVSSRFSEYRPEDLGIACDTTVPESVLGPALLKTRRIFSDNKTSTYQPNMRSGRVNAKVLGRRAWTRDDDRLFGKRTTPTKKDYAVSIGMDISSSNLGANLAHLKRAVMAQAELCARTGVDFAITAHAARRSMSGDGSYVLHIVHVKNWNEPWTPQVRERLATLAAVGGNLDGHAMEFLRKDLMKQPATDRVMLYYTDGKMPAANKDEELTVLQQQIKYCRRDGVTLLGVGINTDSPKAHGLDTVEVKSDDDLKAVVEHLGKRLTKTAR